MRKILVAAAIGVLAAVAPAAAQKTGKIAGIVTDTTGRPLADVDVVAADDGSARARTDSAGRFEIRNLDDGVYAVRVRRIGYLPTRETADIGHGGKVDLRIELKAKPAMLDSVIVIGEAKCPDRAYVGFLCRKATGKGTYLTDDDLFDKDAREIGDIFRGIPGFKVEDRSTNWGRKPFVVPQKAGACLNALVNGRVSSVTNPIPRYADMMIAVEIYAQPADIPQEYQRYSYGLEGRQAQMYGDRGMANGRCSLVVYWTSFGRS